MSSENTNLLIKVGIIALVVIVFFKVFKGLMSWIKNTFTNADDAKDVYAGIATVEDADAKTIELRQSYEPDWSQVNGGRPRIDALVTQLVGMGNSMVDSSSSIVAICQPLNSVELDALYWCYGYRVYDPWFSTQYVTDLHGLFRETVRYWYFGVNYQKQLEEIWAKSRFKYISA